MGILEYARNNILISDGAMGTMLQKSGLAVGQNPEILNITSPQVVRDIHAAYFAAGSNVVVTNTFGANAHKLLNTGYTVDEIIGAAVGIAKEAAAEYGGFVALDIGPVGELLEPMGRLTFEAAYELFKEQVIAGAKHGADAVFIETMTDLYEAKCAVLAVKENCGLPVFCTMSFEENMRTFTGTSISAMAMTLEGLGVDFIGINCSLGPSQIYPMVKELKKWTNLPIIIQPNAGLPEVINGKTVFNVMPEEFAGEMAKILGLGVNAIGGCCGTTPEFIKILTDISRNVKPITKEKAEVCAVCSSSKTVEIDRVRIIGERINPTGKKKFKQALLDSNIDFILAQAIEQIEAGADILDVNVGLPEIDEIAMMITVVKAIQSISDTPLQIDSTDPRVIEAALRVYNGKAIVNSVNGEDENLEAILPVVKKYGASVVGLTLDKTGIPKTAEKRFEIAEKIVNKAAEYGISRNNVFIDCLTLTTSAEQALAFETIKAVALVKERLAVKTVLGVSNISFGLPARETMNQVFLSIALNSGLDLPIINPNIKGMVDTIYCFHQLKNIDAGSREYVERFSKPQNETKLEPENVSPKNDISFYMKKGLKDETNICCGRLLEEHEALTVVNKFLIPALDEIGKDYETGRIFLPQLLQSAEAAKSAFELVKNKASLNPASEAEAGQKIILATVKGDIHDIGKNIVKVILENYGYYVIDLGKDVEIERVVDAAVKNGVGLVGLSALMTTTLPNMTQTIKALKERCRGIKIMVGGAVLTEDYAKQIGSDFYAKDAMSAVAIAKEHFDRGDKIDL